MGRFFFGLFMAVLVVACLLALSGRAEASGNVGPVCMNKQGVRVACPASVISAYQARVRSNEAIFAMHRAYPPSSEADFQACVAKSKNPAWASKHFRGEGGCW